MLTPGNPPHPALPLGGAPFPGKLPPPREARASAALPAVEGTGSEFVQFPTGGGRFGLLPRRIAVALDDLDRREPTELPLSDYLDLLPDVVRSASAGRAAGRHQTGSLRALFSGDQLSSFNLWMERRTALRKSSPAEMQALEHCLRFDTRGVDANDPSAFLAVLPAELEVARSYRHETSGFGTGRSTLELRRARDLITLETGEYAFVRLEIDLQRAGRDFTVSRYSNRTEIVAGPELVLALTSLDREAVSRTLSEIGAAVRKALEPAPLPRVRPTPLGDLGTSLGLWWATAVDWIRHQVSRWRRND